MSRIGHYELKELLGSGGTGQVHIAVDTLIGREVAVKSLRPELGRDPSFVDRFKSEAASLARLNHPNICTLFAVFPESDNFYMVMELVRGSTLETILQKRPTGLTLAESLAILGQVGEGLSYAHRMGVIHRDLKPSNLMVADDGRVKIMDFGIARVQGSQRLTRDGSIVGTLAYIAPEQVRGAQGDEASDIYSLAMVLYELLCGAPPFIGSTDYDLIQAHVNKKPERPGSRVPGGLPRHIDAAIMRALSKTPEQRFPSVRDFLDALGATGSPDVKLSAQLLTAPGTQLALQGDIRPMRPPGRPSGSHVKPLVVGLLVGTSAATAISAVLLGLVPLDPLLDWVGGQVRPEKRPPPISTPDQPAQPQSRNPYTIPSNVPKPRAESGPLKLADTPPAPVDAPPKPVDAPSLGELRATLIKAYESQNFGEAFQLAQTLANMKSVDGYRMLGVLYEQGKGTLPNYGLAERYYRQAADFGDAKSELNLGNMFFEGKGQVTADVGKALFWFKKAAEHSDPRAMYFVGIIYENGYGIPKDEREAKFWYSRSAGLGYTPAQEKLSSLR